MTSAFQQICVRGAFRGHRRGGAAAACRGKAGRQAWQEPRTSPHRRSGGSLLPWGWFSGACWTVRRDSPRRRDGQQWGLQDVGTCLSSLKPWAGDPRTTPMTLGGVLGLGLRRGRSGPSTQPPAHALVLEGRGANSHLGSRAASDSGGRCEGSGQGSEISSDSGFKWSFEIAD